MKEFDPTQIDSTRAYIESLNAPVETTEIDGIAYSYYVLPQSLNPDLPDFAFRMTGLNPETGNTEGIYGVSDSVPESLRPFWAAHEVREFAQIGINAPERCITSEQQTVRSIPPELQSGYVNRRIAFFNNLLKYFQTEIEKDSGNFSVEDIEEAKKTKAYLESLS